MLGENICEKLVSAFTGNTMLKKIKLTRPNAPTHYLKVVGFTEGFGFSQIHITFVKNIKYSLGKVIVC